VSLWYFFYDNCFFARNERSGLRRAGSKNENTTAVAIATIIRRITVINTAAYAYCYSQLSIYMTSVFKAVTTSALRTVIKTV